MARISRACVYTLFFSQSNRSNARAAYLRVAALLSDVHYVGSVSYFTNVYIQAHIFGAIACLVANVVPLESSLNLRKNEGGFDNFRPFLRKI